MKYFLFFCFAMFTGNAAFSQMIDMTDSIRQDTIFIDVKSKETTDVRKGTSKMIVLRNVVTENIKDMTIYLESTQKNIIKWKQIEFKNNEIWIPTELLVDDFYSVHVMKGKVIELTRRLRIR